jgi:hypothetical protein
MLPLYLHILISNKQGSEVKMSELHLNCLLKEYCASYKCGICINRRNYVVVIIFYVTYERG